MDIVKIFTANKQIELQCDINEWLRENKDKYVLKQISYSTSMAKTNYDFNKEYSAMLWYSSKTF